MCTGRIDLAFILRAFTNKADGVFIGGCWPGECHYLTEGNYLALSGMHLTRRLLELIGIDPQRLRLEWVSASQGSRFAEVMNDFSGQLKALGPLGQGEQSDPEEMKSKLETVTQLVPYVKLVERERLRIPYKSEEAYNAFFAGEEFERLFKELIVDKFEISRILTLLRQQPLSAGEIARRLSLNPSDVSRHLFSSARQGLISFDGDQDLIQAA